MTGLLPGNCKTVNEAAAWAIKELMLVGQGAAIITTYRTNAVTDSMMFRERHSKIVQWLARRNDRRIAAMSKELNKHYDFFDQLPVSYDDLFPEDEDD